MASLPIDPEQMEEPDEGMDDSELVSILSAHEMQAIGYQPGGDDEISAQQERALNYYYGIMDDVPAQEGCSSVTDRTVQIVIDNALAALLKPFLSSDETVSFSPRGPEDVEVAEQATEYVNFVFNCDNPGPLILYNWFKDAALSKLGIVKVWWEDEAKLNAEQVEITDKMSASVIRLHPEYLGEENGIATIGRVEQGGKIKIENVPPEEFRISPMARDIETAIYTAHVPLNVTRSDLVEMGFDHEIIETLPAISGSSTDNTLRVARYNDERIGDESVSSPHRSQERVALRDEYIRVDYDDDGVAELRRVLRVGDVILLNEEVEESPFATLCPVPMPHKVFGLSLADLAIEDQKVATVLLRQTLDNLYKSNNPRPVIARNGVTMDGATHETLADNAPGAAIEVETLDAFRFDAVPFTADKSFPMIEFIARRTEETTGISKSGQGLDANSLKKSGQMTATEISQIASGKNARTEMVARIFAETGVRRMFSLILKLLSRHQQQERVIRLRNRFVAVDPSGWPEMDLQISVGLGVGDKTEQMAMAQQVLQVMESLGQTPFASLIGPQQVYNAVKRLFTAAGIKNTDDYLAEPQEQPQQDKPSPEEQKVQAEMQLQAAKLQGEQQMQAAKLDMQVQEQQAKQRLAREQAEFEAELAHAKAQQEADLAQQKFVMEAAMAERKMEFEASLAARRTEQAHEANMTKANLSANRPGGSLAE